MKLMNVTLIGDPCIDVREVLPNTPLGDKNKKPFQALQSALIKVSAINKKGIIKTYTISNDCGYIYDGASIPFKIGKGNMKLLIPSLYHDIMCENKRKIDFNRNLSSLIFRELLIQCGVNKVIAQLMYLAVDNYQRFMNGWKK